MTGTAAALIAESGVTLEPRDRLHDVAARAGLTVLAWRDATAKRSACRALTTRYPEHEALLVTEVSMPVLDDAWHLILDRDVITIDEYLELLTRAHPRLWIFDTTDAKVIARAVRLAYLGSSVVLAVEGPDYCGALSQLADAPQSFELVEALTTVVYVG